MSTAELIDEITSAFKARHIPSDRIVDASVDLNYHAEAQRVDAYLRKYRKIIDRSNHALSIFHYLTPEAALWILPSCMISIIETSGRDDFFIDLVAGALASGTPGARYRSQGELGIKMRERATEEEAQSVRDFLHWIRSDRSDGIEAEIESALEIWRKNSKAVLP